MSISSVGRVESKISGLKLEEAEPERGGAPRHCHVIHRLVSIHYLTGNMKSLKIRIMSEMGHKEQLKIAASTLCEGK